MIASMTGFARRVEKTQWGEITWNIRSLNHKSLDVSLQVPEPFRALESQCRRAIVESFSRGRIDASLSVTRAGADCETPLLDEAALQSLLAYANSVRQWVPDAAPLTITEILRWPGVVNTDAEPEQELAQSVVATLGQVLADLTHDRQREGALVKAILFEKLEQFKAGSHEARQFLPAAQRNLQDRMVEKLAELDLEVDPGRWEQEIGLVLVKLDVVEEADRLDLHVAEFERVLDEESVVGKRLGFIIQELGREVNTLGSKSMYYPLNALMVEMKVILEQIREQIQNVE